MDVLDAINGRWCRATIRLANVPTNPDWGNAQRYDESELYDSLGSALDCLLPITRTSTGCQTVQKEYYEITAQLDECSERAFRR